MKRKAAIAASAAVTAVVASFTMAAATADATPAPHAQATAGYAALGRITSVFNPKYCLTATHGAADNDYVYVRPCLPEGKDTWQVWSLTRAGGTGYITLAAKPHLVLAQKGSALAKTVDFTKEPTGYTAFVQYLEVGNATANKWELDLPYYHSRQLTTPASVAKKKGTRTAIWADPRRIAQAQREWYLPKWERVNVTFKPLCASCRGVHAAWSQDGGNAER